ncbi:amidinotransferase [Polaromonas sp.]|nr:amidinotransferase [Candidatus Saccharibacteria bacterium]
MSPIINARVLMSDAAHFDDSAPINPYMDGAVAINREKAQQEHDSIREALLAAGVEVKQVPSPEDCQDGVYTANWALVHGEMAIMSRLPNARKGEEAYARQVLTDLGKTIVTVPNELRFSGQGDALPCGKYLFCGSQYRTDGAVHQFLGDTLGLNAISLQTVPQMDDNGQPMTNASSGWPDSFFYDIDLALAVLRPDLMAWCPKAFMPESQEKLRSLPIEKIEISLEEATQAFACNLVSTGETVIMSAHAPQFQAAVESYGLKTITPEISELAKGGGYIRCTTLTLS